MNTQRHWPVSPSLGKTTMNLGDICRQLSDAQWAIIGGFVAAAVLLGSAVIIHFWRGASLSILMRDPASYVDLPAYIGAISHIGVMMWTVTGAICLFTAWAIRRGGADRGDVRFLAWSGLGTLYLGLDDVMLLHEIIIPKLTGLWKEVIIAAYVAAFVLYLVRFRTAILKAEYALLGIALFFFGLSVVHDIMMPLSSDLKTFFEDAAKLLGIIFWLIFYVRTGATAMRSQHRRPVGTNARR